MSDNYPCGHNRGGDNDQWFKNGSRQSRRCRQCNVNDVNARGKAGRDALRTLQSIPMLSVPAGWVLVPVADLRVLADLRQHIHQHEPDRVKWEGEWHYGPLATAFISTIEAVADAADTMLAATPAPPIEGRDADVERVAREAANGLDWDKVYAAARKRALNEVTGTSYDEYLAREIADRIARAALQALGERG